MNLAQRIVVVVAAGLIARVVAAHGAEYLLYHVESHASLVRHGFQALVAAVWGGFGFVLMREAA